MAKKNLLLPFVMGRNNILTGLRSLAPLDFRPRQKKIIVNVRLFLEDTVIK